MLVVILECDETVTRIGGKVRTSKYYDYDI